MRCVFPYFKNDSFHIQIQHVVVFATKWLETLLLKLNGLKSQNISVCLKYRANLKLHHVMCVYPIQYVIFNALKEYCIPKEEEERILTSVI